MTTRNEHTVRYTAEEIDEMLARGEDRTDWDRVRNMTEEEIEAAVDSDEEGEIDWDKILIGVSGGKKQLTIRLDSDVVEWFKRQGAGYQTRINQVLRSYVEAQRDKKVS